MAALTESVTGILAQDLTVVDVEATAESVLDLLGSINGQIELANLELLNGNLEQLNSVLENRAYWDWMHQPRCNSTMEVCSPAR